MKYDQFFKISKLVLPPRSQSSSVKNEEVSQLNVVIPASSVSVSSTDVIETPNSKHFFMCALDFICFVRFPRKHRQKKREIN